MSNLSRVRSGYGPFRPRGLFFIGHWHLEERHHVLCYNAMELWGFRRPNLTYEHPVGPSAEHRDGSRGDLEGASPESAGLFKHIDW